MAEQTTNHSLNKPIPWDESDEDNNVWGDLLVENIERFDDLIPHEITSSVVTASGGQTQNQFTLSGVVDGQKTPFDVVVSVASVPDFNADYQYHVNVMRLWDSGSQHWDIVVEIIWDADPGNGNDVDFEISVRDKSI